MKNTDGSLLSDGDFEKKMRELKKEKAELESKKGRVGERVNNWLELSTKTFNFACYARAHFENAKTLREKKEILATIGSNFVLKDKILSLTVPKPYIAIRKTKEITDRLSARLEPSEKVDLIGQMMHSKDDLETLLAIPL